MYTLRDFNYSIYLSIDGDSGYTGSWLETMLTCAWRQELNCTSRRYSVAPADGSWLEIDHGCTMEDLVLDIYTQILMICRD